MKSLFILLLLVATPFASIFAQETANFDGKTYYISFDKNPQFPDTDADLFEYIEHVLSLELTLPQMDRLQGVGSYHSLVRLVLDTTGKITYAAIDYRSEHNWLTHELEEVFNSMHNWVPGEVKGKKVEALVYVAVELYAEDQTVRVRYNPVFDDSYYYAKDPEPAPLIVSIVLAALGTAVVFGLGGLLYNVLN